MIGKLVLAAALVALLTSGCKKTGDGAKPGTQASGEVAARHPMPSGPDLPTKRGEANSIYHEVMGCLRDRNNKDDSSRHSRPFLNLGNEEACSFYCAPAQLGQLKTILPTAKERGLLEHPGLKVTFSTIERSKDQFGNDESTTKTEERKVSVLALKNGEIPPTAEGLETACQIYLSPPPMDDHHNLRCTDAQFRSNFNACGLTLRVTPGIDFRMR